MTMCLTSRAQLPLPEPAGASRHELQPPQQRLRLHVVVAGCVGLVVVVSTLAVVLFVNLLLGLLFTYITSPSPSLLQLDVLLPAHTTVGCFLHGFAPSPCSACPRSSPFTSFFTSFSSFFFAMFSSRTLRTCTGWGHHILLLLSELHTSDSTCSSSSYTIVEIISV